MSSSSMRWRWHWPYGYAPNDLPLYCARAETRPPIGEGSFSEGSPFVLPGCLGWRSRRPRARVHLVQMLRGLCGGAAGLLAALR